MIRSRGAQVASGERQEDVVGIGAESHDQRTRPFNACFQERVLVGRVAREEQKAAVGRLGDNLSLVLDHDERDLAAGQFLA